jgi:hypothetical protein
MCGHFQRDEELFAQNFSGMNRSQFIYRLLGAGAKTHGTGRADSTAEKKPIDCRAQKRIEYWWSQPLTEGGL